MLPGYERRLRELDKARPLAPSVVPAENMLRAAWVCGALPLCLGVALFVVWLLTRWTLLVGGGILLLLVGPALFALGVLLLGWYVFRCRRLARPVGLAALACSVLLVANFPAAAAIVYAVIQIEFRYVVVIHNRTDLPLEDVRAHGGGADASWKVISPGHTITRYLRFNRDGELLFEATLAGRSISAQVEGYVTSLGRGSAEIRVQQDGTIAVSTKVDGD